MNALSPLASFDTSYSMDVSAYDEMANYDSMFMGGMGLGLNPRHYKAMMTEMNSGYHEYESNDILASDKETLAPIVENISKYRIFGKKYMEKDRVTSMLNAAKDEDGAHKALAAVKLYNAMNAGLIQHGGEITFENQNRPELFVKNTKSLALTAGGSHNKNIDKLNMVAIKAHSPELAAILLHETSKGVGSDHKTIKTLLIDSKKHMDENTYNKFISETSNAYENITGKSLDHFIRQTHSNSGWLKLSWVGVTRKGKEYLSVIDNARQNTHSVSSSNAAMFE